MDRDVDLDQTRYLNPPPELAGEGIRWTGHIHAGGSITQGNTEVKSLHVDAETVARDLSDRYTLGGPGIGYQVFETPTLNLSLEGGANYIHEDYYAAADKAYPSARWAIRYDQRVLNGYAQIFHEHEALVGFDKGKQILLSSKTGIRFPIVLNMNASAQFNYNWDSDPAPGRRKEDTDLIFTVGYGW